MLLVPSSSVSSRVERTQTTRTTRTHCRRAAACCFFAICCCCCCCSFCCSFCCCCSFFSFSFSSGYLPPANAELPVARSASSFWPGALAAATRSALPGAVLWRCLHSHQITEEEVELCAEEIQGSDGNGRSRQREYSHETLFSHRLSQTPSVPPPLYLNNVTSAAACRPPQLRHPPLRRRVRVTRRRVIVADQRAASITHAYPPHSTSAFHLNGTSHGYMTLEGRRCYARSGDLGTHTGGWAQLMAPIDTHGKQKVF